MRLSEWISVNMEAVLQVWEDNAKDLLHDKSASKVERRDHAKAMLLSIVHEMDQYQSERQRDDRGAKTPNLDEASISSRYHGQERRQLGLDIVELAGEFFALRSSVVELWTQDAFDLRPSSLGELVLFDRAIDQALLGSIESFTEEKEKQERSFLSMLSGSPDPAYLVDLSGRVVFANIATAVLLGRPVNQLAGVAVADMWPEQDNDLPSQFETVIEMKKTLRGEVTAGTGSEKRWYEYIYSPVMDASGLVEAIAGAARDITERRKAEAEIWRHANYDLLTDLPNRRLFRDRLDQQTRHSERTGAPFALLFVDLDNFKEVNDTLGHEAGDQLLKQASKRLLGSVREEDTVARLSGDEFTVILLDIGDLAQIEQLARGIISELAKPFDFGGGASRVSGSIGIARYPQDGKTPDQLLMHADQAMYRAKKNGRNQVHSFSRIQPDQQKPDLAEPVTSA
ncbi:GGDEF domain-containing protein [Marinobacter changyiensis]|uniref:GGDEF domain-containing protein n=1 Tax=Marinobacter changyiensis TaxID=2604091 RepID=UPI0012654149|nr:GGDEF domain-containing protein [Marinobacter changyiensis]